MDGNFLLCQQVMHTWYGLPRCAVKYKKKMEVHVLTNQKEPYYTSIVTCSYGGQWSGTY